MKNVSDKDVENIKIHILYSVTFFFPLKPCRFWDNMEGPCRAGQAIDENVAHARWMLGTLRYKYTPRICNSYFLFIATMVARTRLNVTLYVHCLVGLHSCNKRILEFAPCLLLSSSQSYETPIVTKQWFCQCTNHLPLSLINHSAYLHWVKEWEECPVILNLQNV